MITVLSHIFIRQREGAAGRRAYGTLCSIVGILLNILLFAGKYAAGTVSGSVAIVADAFNNLSDAGSSVITLVGFVFAGKKPDSDHPFGHGRVEYVSGFLVAMVILLMGLELLQDSIYKIIHPESVETGALVIAMLLASILVKLYMAFYNYAIGKRIDSAAMAATATDSLSDVAATSVVLVAVLVMKYTGVNVDGICGVVVALFILYAGYSAAKDTLDPLLGRAPDPELVDRIKEIVLEHEGVLGVHDLLVHDYGPGRRVASIHAEAPGNRSVYEIHEIVDHIEREIKEKLDCDMVIHVDPVDPDNAETKRLKAMVETMVKSIDERMTIHDFHVVTSINVKRLIFDAEAPYDLKMDVEEIKNRLEKMVKESEGNYMAMVNVDRVD